MFDLDYRLKLKLYIPPQMNGIEKKPSTFLDKVFHGDLMHGCSCIMIYR